MKRTTIDLWVGIFVTLGLGALVFLSFQVATQSSFSRSSSYEVKARFEDLGGLKVQAPVKSAGVLVGRVTGVRFDNTTFEAEVSFAIDNRYKFPTDTSAKILTSGLLGDQYIGLTPGAEIDELQPGGTIEITQSAIVLEKLIGQFLYSKAAGSDSPEADKAQKPAADAEPPSP
jgi:phospholipid/cholesterol/gamma-HCH transport system substrate-binding protein